MVVKPEAQALKGHLDMLLLAALEGGPRHGYAVKEALREGSGGRFDLPTGTVYPALHRLEKAGLIAGSWSVVEGRRRRSYRGWFGKRRGFPTGIRPGRRGWPAAGGWRGCSARAGSGWRARPR